MGSGAEPTGQHHNIFALGSGATDAVRDPRPDQIRTPDVGEDDVDAVDLRSIGDAAERVRQEEAVRYAAMCRRRREAAKSAEMAASGRSRAETAIEPPTKSPETRRELRTKRALSYCAGDDRKLTAYLRHHEAEVGPRRVHCCRHRCAFCSQAHAWLSPLRLLVCLRRSKATRQQSSTPGQELHCAPPFWTGATTRSRQPKPGSTARSGRSPMLSARDR